MNKFILLTVLLSVIYVVSGQTTVTSHTPKGVGNSPTGVMVQKRTVSPHMLGGKDPVKAHNVPRGHLSGAFAEQITKPYATLHHLPSNHVSIKKSKKVSATTKSLSPCNGC